MIDARRLGSRLPPGARLTDNGNTLVVDINGRAMRVPVVMDTCRTCDGRGSYVNPDIDEHGLTREDFDSDPGFEEDYRSGVYDVGCGACDGSGSVPVPVGDSDEARALRAEMEHIEDCLRTEAWERRHGY